MKRSSKKGFAGHGSVLSVHGGIITLLYIVTDLTDFCDQGYEHLKRGSFFHLFDVIQEESHKQGAKSSAEKASFDHTGEIIYSLWSQQVNIWRLRKTKFMEVVK